MARRKRLLDLLCTLHPDRDREELLSLILCGEISVSGSIIRDPKLLVPADAPLSVLRRRFVSRGGLKLEHALETFRIDVTGLVCVDAGASTGGFTDCLLKRGARCVHAVDVGTNQLAWALRNDGRVLVHENTSIMDVGHLDPPPNLAVCDLSFRSLRGAAAHLLTLTERRRAVVLIKPQFEWEDVSPEFDGTVPAEEAPGIAVATLESLTQEGIGALAVCESPITGRKGNREFLAYIGIEPEDGLGPAAIAELLRS